MREVSERLLRSAIASIRADDGEIYSPRCAVLSGHTAKDRSCIAEIAGSTGIGLAWMLDKIQLGGEMISKTDRLELQVGGTPQKQDPVVSDQAGRMLRSDPVHPIAGSDMPNPDLVRVRAYQLYEQHGRRDGAALNDWLQAETELRSKQRVAAKDTVSGPEPMGAPELSSRM